MLKQEEITQSLQRIPCFLDLKLESLSRLAEIAAYRSLNNGDYLFEEGDREDNLYILLEGQVNIYSHIPNHGDILIFQAEPLDMIGWSSLTPVVRQRTASARLVADSIFISIQGDALRKLCDQDHDLGYAMMRRITNIIASRFLATRLQLYDIIGKA